MTPLNELARTPEYWITNIQNDFYTLANDYAKSQKWPLQFAKQLSEHLGTTRIKASQIIDGDFDGTLSELIEYTLKLGAGPVIEFQPLADYIKKAFNQ